MGFIPEIERVTEDPLYASIVHCLYIQSGNVSIFDRSVLAYATARAFESADDVLVDNVIEAVSLLDRASHALTQLAYAARDKGLIETWHICRETLAEVMDEIDIMDEWLTEGPEV